MGISSSSPSLSAEALEEYTELLYLTKFEIKHLYNRLKDVVGPEAGSARLDSVVIGTSFPELRYNPFLDRIFHVFSSQGDQKLSFEDLLDLYSALNDKCPSEVKARWAFLLFDFDGDGHINRDDIVEIIMRLQGKGIIENDDSTIVASSIADKIMQDLDLDRTGGITSSEFTHAVIKMPDFANSFKLKV